MFLYDTKAARLHQATTGYLTDAQPTFDPEGKYLFYASDREFEPVYGSFDNSWTYPNPTQLVAVPLRKDVKSPLAPRERLRESAARHGRQGATSRATRTRTRTTRRRSDKDKKPEQDKSPDGKQDDDKNDAKRRREEAGGQEGRRAPAAPANVDIDLDGFEARAIVLPPKAGNYADLSRSKASCSTAACRAPARATTRTRSSTSISPSARRRRSSTTRTGSR